MTSARSLGITASGGPLLREERRATLGGVDDVRASGAVRYLSPGRIRRAHMDAIYLCFVAASRSLTRAPERMPVRA